MIGLASPASALGGEPLKVLLVVGGLASVTVLVALALRRFDHRARSLRGQVLTITLAGLALGVVAALGLGWLMVLDTNELHAVLVSLTVTALLASGLVLVASSPLGSDARALEQMVRRIERGERDVVRDVERADELGHVARALEELTVRLDQLERERETFETERAAMLSSVSHDLRTPLAALRAAVEALADGVAPDPARYLRSMQRDVDALASLVDDLFLLTRVESGRLEVPDQVVDLSEIADEAIEALTPVAAARRIGITLDTPGRVRVRGNAAALGRVIRNLLDNAIRHAPVGSGITVTVGGDGAPAITVTDEGPGFPTGFVGEAFDHFTRADASRNRDTGGAGLGLAIARSVVEAHGGRIRIEHGAGGRVTFELPAA